MISIYHRCPAFATGSIDGMRWDAQLDAGEWHVRVWGAPYPEVPELAARIRLAARLDTSLLQAAAAAQDARAEAPDL